MNIATANWTAPASEPWTSPDTSSVYRPTTLRTSWSMFTPTRSIQPTAPAAGVRVSASRTTPPACCSRARSPADAASRASS